MPPPKSLVIGGAGSIGKNLMKHLGKRGDFLVAGLRKTHLPPEISKLVTHSELGLDVRDKGSIKSIFEKHPQIDTVWNLAAPLSVETAANPKVAEEVVVGGMTNVLEAMRESGVKRMVFSDSIGSLGADAPRENCPASWVTENPTQDPGSDYGVQKRACRNLMKQYTDEHGFDTRWAMIPGVLHSDHRWGAGTTEYALDAMKAAALGEKFMCPVDPDVMMPFVYIPDLVDTLTALGDAESSALKEPEHGYAVPAFSFSARQLFDEIKKHEPGFTWEVQLNDNMDKFSRLWPNSMSGEAAKRDLGITPKFGLPETVKNTLESHYERIKQAKDLEKAQKEMPTGASVDIPFHK